MPEITWDPTIPGQKVRLIDNPGSQGLTTGRTMPAGTRLLVQVEFGPGERNYKPYDLLEVCPDSEDPLDLLVRGRFGTPQDLQRILTLEKIKGRLTNIFYSMESSNTDFYPFQFKPVLKFIESPVGRLLIADEVGLGKTIEAGYIWKELQAREDAKRLLVICPAMLRDKWRDDLLNKFGIVAEIVDAKTLLERLKAYSPQRLNQPFAYISSLEGPRTPRGYEDESNNNTRAEIGRLLEENSATPDSAIIDLVVIDEAGYLRNPETASNRLGRLIRDSAQHLLLLTATPVQVDSLNLYHLLNLIDPDTFFNRQIFGDMLEANRPIIRALRNVWGNPPNIEAARLDVIEALQSPYLEANPILKQVSRTLENDISDEYAQRIWVGRMLENSSILGQFMNRSRKRDVLENRVERSAQVLRVDFNDMERMVYNHVHDQIRIRHSGGNIIAVFTHILRLRQLSSCIVAALEAWEEQGLAEELLWQDFGVSSILNMDSREPNNSTDGNNTWDNDLLPQDINIQLLEQNDQKFKELRDFLKQEMEKNPKEKFVIFAYFRQTLFYLHRRLEAEGIHTCLIMGGMGDEKYDELARFAGEKEPNVLLSSDVGSEGIDLQFCRFLVNYDLPWNPMRVEQRIGRLDRLGQQAEKISIINFSIANTIEERVLMRLYNRINIFRETIGDLEEILGEITERLILDLLSPDLSDEEKEQKAEEIALTIEKKRADQNRLENEAINLLAFSDYILDAINDSREKGYWLSSEEQFNLIDDFFRRQYPGTVIEPIQGEPNTYSISLSEDARIALRLYIEEHSPGTGTSLHTSYGPVVCIFDPRGSRQQLKKAEIVEPTHPLVRWIRNEYENRDIAMHSVSAIRVRADQVDLGPGIYVYMAQLWTFKGLRTECRMTFKLASIEESRLIEDDISEDVITKAVRVGESIPNAANRLGDKERIIALAKQCNGYLTVQFDNYLNAFEAENNSRCDIQEQSARKFAQRKTDELKARIQRFKEEGKQRMIPATEGLLRKAEGELRIKLARINTRRIIDPSLTLLAAGVIIVE